MHIQKHISSKTAYINEEYIKQQNNGDDQNTKNLCLNRWQIVVAC